MTNKPNLAASNSKCQGFSMIPTVTRRVTTYVVPVLNKMLNTIF